MIIKCKMCGGDIEFTQGATYGTCEYCGSTSTIPKAEDEMTLNRYNRANHFRRQCEFDKAVAAYEKILEQDDTDAEAHWGAVLSRYGIEYVEDPATKKRIPTCHRLQVASILADEDYLAAVEHASDSESRRLYEEQATQIAEIQKGILAISANEKPYDVFICYKETDENGQRTRDSQWAQDVYYGLTDAGYKVFFSRITLEDKLGQQYEPYIFAALNSAKVMVVIGSKAEYFNAVWVKNEWSRYLALMAKDRKRLLIPCYRDMDPYDLPEELSALQSQDMSKIGFMQDLLRGVKKVLDADKKTEPAAKTPAKLAETAAAPGVTSLMGRAYLFMEDGNFNSAREYLDRVLDIDPKYAPAYAAKTCVEYKFRKEADLANAVFLYEDNADWQKALRFANASQKATYQGYIEQVRARVQKQIRNFAYDCAVAMAVNTGNADSVNNDLSQELEERSNLWMNVHKLYCWPEVEPEFRLSHWQSNEAAFQKAVSTNEPGDVSERSYQLAAEKFDAIGDEEAKSLALQCHTLAEQAWQKKIYVEAAAVPSTASITDLRRAQQLFASIPQYKDAETRAQKTQEKINAIQANAYAEAVRATENAGEDSRNWAAVKTKLQDTVLDNYRDVAELRTQAAKRYTECFNKECELKRRQEEAAAAKKKKLTIIGAAAAVVAIAIIMLVTQVFIPSNNYNNAVSLRATGQYEEAIAAFTELGGYSDAADQVTETYYQQALALTAAQDYAGAAAIFIKISGYKDVDTLLETDENLKAAAAAAAAARDAKFTVGNYVEFGTYPQTAAGTDNTPIEWLVLARDGNKALLISRYGLDAQHYNAEYIKDVTWETCTLRTWLNDTFMNKAFTAAEQKAILTTTVDNSNSQGYSGWSTSGGNNTKDQIFLLSYAEENKYFGVTYSDSNSTKARVKPTAYAEKLGAYTSSSNKTADGDNAGWWWLRSPGYFQISAACVRYDGSLDYNGAGFGDGCVRPALWVNLESGIF